jgi:hypothetical protein
VITENFQPAFSSTISDFPNATNNAWKAIFRKTLYRFTLAVLGIVSTLAWIVYAPAISHAGASASHWAVVVNGDSISSRTVANHFCSLRGIPSNNVIVLFGIPESDRVSIEFFRNSILLPVLTQIEQRGLGRHLQGIAYSVDFPTAIDVAPEVNSLPDKSPYLTPVASINGLTYFFKHVVAGSPAYLSFEANGYASRPGSSLLRPLIADAEIMKDLVAKSQAMDWENAAKIFDQEVQKLPRDLRPPMQVIAAQLWMKNDNSDEALARLEQAVLGGWSYRSALADDELFQPLQNDPRMKRILKLCKDDPFDFTPFRGFDARTTFAPNSLATKQPNFGTTYLLSTMLGVSKDFGITRFEVIDGLKRSTQSDFQPIDGTFLFTKTGDVRTTTRLPFFDLAIQRLKKKGFDARVIEEALPTKRVKCAGLMIGTPTFQLAQSGAELMPGAIADNLTSLGGAMTDASQTKATEFIRHGAAISSGAVTEPYSIINKFPNPLIHDAYTDGMTSAEAFYSTVLCPYQLLIVGDPLCQPFAKPPRFQIMEAPEQIARNQSIQLRFSQDADAPAIDTVTCTIDGIYINEVLFEPDLQLNTSNAPLGWHELRVIAKGNGPIQHRFEQNHWVYLFDEASDLQKKDRVTWSCPDTVDLQKTPELEITSSGFATDREIEVWHELEKIGSIQAGPSKLPLSMPQVGTGPVRLQLKQQREDGRTVHSALRTVQVNP